ncbi:hypothetical protein QYF61_012494 [Mycteria americana]|uniref:Uncharacterized protein n=1 Tax=Mycteria americana TaxID=33587 RepID=A0AAN7NTD7_MYCAM|nr:hypothetical protein QYF61_012494 [Mycteria americana]
MLTGPDDLLVLYVPRDGIQDDLLHNLPQHQESQNRIGWKRPLSPSPTVNLTLPRPPLYHVPKHLIQTSFKYFQGWQLNHFPGQPVPMLDNPFSEVVVESNKVFPQPPFLQAKQPQFPQMLLIRLLLQTLHQLRCPSLHTLQHLHVPLVVGGP